MRYTQMPLRHAAVDLAFITDNDDAKCSKTEHILLVIDSPAGYCPVTYIFQKAFVELMLSSN